MNANEQGNNEPSGPGAMQPGTSQVTHVGLLDVLLRRRWQLLACLLLVSCMAFSVTVFRKPWYKATSRVKVVRAQSQAVGMSALLGGRSDDFAGYCELIDSRRVLERAIERLNMAGIPWPTDADGVELLRERIDIEPLANSRMIDIVGSARTGTEAGALANHLMAAFIETCAESKVVDNRGMIERLQEQIRIYANEIEVQDDAVNRFREQNQITGNGAGMAVVMGRINILEGKLTESQMLNLQLKTRTEKLAQLLTNSTDLGAGDTDIAEINRDPEVLSLRQKMQQLRQQRVRLTREYLPGHRMLRNLESEVAGSKQRLQERTLQLVKSLHLQALDQYISLATRDQDIRKSLDEQREISFVMSGRLQDYQKLVQKLELMHTFQAECVKQIRQLGMQAELDGPPIRVVDAAIIPNRPSGLTQRQQAGSILVLGLILSLIFVFAMDRFSLPQDAPFAQSWPGMYYPGGAVPMQAPWPMYWPAGADQTASATPQTAKEVVVKVPATLGHLQKMSIGGDSTSDSAFAARCQIAMSDASSPEAGAFREISAGLLGRFGQSRQSVVITGAQGPNGKTTCACNLALALAQAGRTVCLVDANPENPSLERVFSFVSEAPSANDVVAGNAELGEFVSETEITNLSVASSWADPEQLDHTTMATLNQLLLGRFDWVVYDGGSIETDFTSTLLSAVGKALIVTSQTDDDLVSQATEQAERSGAVTLGCIENCQTQSTSDSAEFAAQGNQFV